MLMITGPYLELSTPVDPKTDKFTVVLWERQEKKLFFFHHVSFLVKHIDIVPSAVYMKELGGTLCEQAEYLNSFGGTDWIFGEKGIVEIIHPVGNSKNSFSDHLDKFGSSFHHIAFGTWDFESAKKTAQKLGLKIHVGRILPNIFKVGFTKITKKGNFGEIGIHTIRLKIYFLVLQ